MTRTLASLGLVLCFAGCLGDDPDHIPTTGYGGLSKGTGRPISSSNTTALRTELRAQLVADGAGGSTAIAAPELCGDCTVTVERTQIARGVELVVRDDHGVELCRVVGRLGALDVDSCGLVE
jgi:hypothetical protein